MNKKGYINIILIIGLTLVTTFGLQIYWNVKNYEENKQNLYREVIAAFDKSIDYYYLEDLKNDNIVIINGSKMGKIDLESENFKSLFKSRKEKKTYKKTTVTLNQNDTVLKKGNNIKNGVLIFTGKKLVDSVARLKQLSNVIISIQRDTINLHKISKALKLELKRKNISIQFVLKQYSLGKEIQSLIETKPLWTGSP